MNVGPLPVTVIVPVKSTERGKSRLRLPEPARRQITRAMALDTVAAIIRAAHALVVVEDRGDAVLFRQVFGGSVRVHRTDRSGLNSAIAEGAGLVRGSGRVAALPADLSGLRSVDLREALIAARDVPFGVVADRHRIGTTLLSARRPELLVPEYGGSSFDRHRLAGAVELSVRPDSTVRMDIDEPADLAGPVGPRLAVALRMTGLFDDSEPGDGAFAGLAS